MSTLRVSTVILFLMWLGATTVAVVLPAFHNSRAGHELRRAAFDAPPDRAAELRARAHAVSRAEKRLIAAAGGIVAVVSGTVLAGRVYRCGGLSAALWQVHSLPPKL